MFCDLVSSGDTEVYAALADESWDVGGWEEDQCDVQVLDEGDVEAVLAAELDVTAGEELESGLLQTALYRVIREDVSYCD